MPWILASTPPSPPPDSGSGGELHGLSACWRTMMAVLPSATANLNLPVITRPVGACGEPSALMSAVPAEPSRFPPVSFFPSEADFNPQLRLLSPTTAAAFGSTSSFFSIFFTTAPSHWFIRSFQLFSSVHSVK